jgi:hypothetical protein
MDESRLPNFLTDVIALDLFKGVFAAARAALAFW